MIEPSVIAEVMGGVAVLGHRLNSLPALSKAVAGGLPKQALKKTALRVFPASRDATRLVYRVVPEATYKRRTRLTAAESERTERLARVVAAAESVWDNRDDARRWLTTPLRELSGKTPIETAMTELGARQVEELLDRIFYGLPA